MSYRKTAKKFLDLQGISVGEQISIKKDGIEYQGMLLDRAEDADEWHVVLKLANGYNIGVNIAEAETKLLEKGEKPKSIFHH
jgi:glutamyl-tRNA(Gln) amidotransferase subunit D